MKDLQINKGCLANEVLGYLVQHPEAQDTADGIAEWWLLEHRIMQVVGNLEAVLRELVNKEFLLVTAGNDGRYYYRLNRNMEREVRSHLRSSAASMLERMEQSTQRKSITG